jgi:hypothetical protein
VGVVAGTFSVGNVLFQVFCCEQKDAVLSLDNETADRDEASGQPWRREQRALPSAERRYRSSIDQRCGTPVVGC